MNDHELEERLRGWYRAEIDEGATSPLPLRAAVHAIPAEVPIPRRAGRRPVLLLVAALAAVGIGGALAVGSNLFRMPTVVPIPSVNVAVVPPSLPVSPDQSPAGSPDGSPTTGPASFEPGFRVLSDMSTPRFQHSATLLSDGRVLIAGGTSVGNHLLGTTEIWDPTTETFTAGPSLSVSRFGHEATRLLDGRVLIVGGFLAGDRGTRELELWDPATGKFRPAGLTTFPRNGSLSTALLANGRVLIIGGVDCDRGVGVGFEARAACMRQRLLTEVWNPATESVTVSGSLDEEHDWGAATLLADGRVFVLGGGQLPTIGSEVWDPATEAWTRGGAPTDARLGGQSHTLLPDGGVLVVGGQTGKLNSGEDFPPPLRGADLWDPATASFLPSGAMQLGRERHTATLLADARVLIVGGVGTPAADFSDNGIAEAELWDPATRSFTTAGEGAVGRALHTATFIQDGRVLITGGFTRLERAETVRDTASAEIWAP
jgi:hypothetical protein